MEVKELYPMQLGRLASLIGGRLLRGTPKTPVKHAVSGTRHLREGVVWFCKPQKNTEKQLRSLRSKKSAGVVVPRGWSKRIPSSHAVIEVSDPQKALWKLVHWQRAQSRALFIGITGSAGKTTTKEMLASILSTQYKVLKSVANNNLHSLMPGNLTLLHPQHQIVILEMGMAGFGNIRKQCQIAKPSLGIVTNVGEAHVGKLGDSLANVARAKQELIDGLAPKGTLILNADDAGSKRLSTRRFRGKVITLGIQNPATLQATRVKYTKNGMSFYIGKVPYQIPVWGQHNIYNALAAIAVAKQLKVPTSKIQKGLQSFPAPRMRLQRIKGIKNWLLINDCYNANPSAMVAGLKVLMQVSGKKQSVAVLGDMHSLGKLSLQSHRQVGKFVAQINPSTLITVGTQARQIAKGASLAGYKGKIRSLPNQPETVAHYLRKNIPTGSVLYFKASRKTALEKTVNKIRFR
ncbi:UDP-N-acetylmuramoyl-tripeptide--D-alanyl-D-alanine ligase [Kroppenstedtia sanguinis]|uniref:UDP-N-acetylmuramoyl-tripeptide--D-alanyl-D-alanine ligase n=1 Tax=Kroppenstedtia sanguinis TaxID=1380684 RepID=A0ABW4C6A8_9BACL